MRGMHPLGRDWTSGRKGQGWSLGSVRSSDGLVDVESILAAAGDGLVACARRVALGHRHALAVEEGATPALIAHRKVRVNDREACRRLSRWLWSRAW